MMTSSHLGTTGKRFSATRDAAGAEFGAQLPCDPRAKCTYDSHTDLSAVDVIEAAGGYGPPGGGGYGPPGGGGGGYGGPPGGGGGGYGGPPGGGGGGYGGPPGGGGGYGGPPGGGPPGGGGYGGPPGGGGYGGPPPGGGGYGGPPPGGGGYGPPGGGYGPPPGGGFGGPPGYPGGDPMQGGQGQRFHPLATTALVTGLVSVPLCCCVYFGAPVPITAIVCGIIGLNKIKANPGMFKGTGFCIAGIVLGAVILLWDIFCIFSSVDDNLRQQYGSSF